MDDYISRQAAIEALGDEPESWNDTDAEIAERNQWRLDSLAIEAVPSADVVPVVRCKDCKKFYFADNRIPVQQGYFCGRYDKYRHPDDFCSRGVRREDDGE